MQTTNEILAALSSSSPAQRAAAVNLLKSGKKMIELTGGGNFTAIAFLASDGHFLRCDIYRPDRSVKHVGEAIYKKHFFNSALRFTVPAASGTDTENDEIE